MIEHDFEPLSGRCRACGTTRVQFDADPAKSPCPQQGSRGEPLRPEPVRRDYAIEAFDVIGRALGRLETEEPLATC